jgi:arylsulfatase A-like enzyme
MQSLARPFVYLILSGMIGLVSLAKRIEATTQEPQRKPNFVLFLVDDLGQRDLGCYGSSFYETPNLDRLATQGTRFTNAYAACPVCSPTRAAFQTGLWPQRTGITDYIGAPLTPDRWKRNTRLLPAPYRDRLEHRNVTMAEMLRELGYATFFAGKWHLGPEGWWPEDQGYDFNRGGNDRGGPYGGNKYFSPYGNPRLSDGPEGEHLPDRLSTEAVRFIQQHRNQPFLVCFSFYSVHTPLLARKDLQEKYEKKRRQASNRAQWGKEDTRDVRLTQDHAVYAGMVEAMDLAVGKVLDHLDAMKLSDDTLVLFTSDNGGLSTSEGWPTSNAPWRAGKGWLYEGGIRVPLLVRWPKGAQAGSVIDTPVCTPDFFPTVAALSGARVAHTIDGVDLRGGLAGHDLEARPLYWHYPHYGNQGGAPGGAVRRGNWKLIQWYESGSIELYNLKEDPSEARELSQREPKVVQELSQLLVRWREDVGALMPTPNPDHDSTKPSGRAGGRPEELVSTAAP